MLGSSDPRVVAEQCEEYRQAAEEWKSKARHFEEELNDLRAEREAQMSNESEKTQDQAPAPEAKAESSAEASNETVTMSKAHHEWLQGLESERDSARRELALVSRVLDGHKDVGAVSGMVDKALGVVEERKHFKATVDALWSLIKFHAYPVGFDSLTRVVERLLVGQRPDRSDWQVKCAEARNERDAALARVAELEATAVREKDTRDKIEKLLWKREPDLSFEKIAQHIARHYPAADVIQVLVYRSGEMAFVPSTDAEFKAALAGKREGNNA